MSAPDFGAFSHIRSLLAGVASSDRLARDVRKVVSLSSPDE
jgi:hypothetical protein